MVWQVRLLAGEPLSAEEQEQLAAHLAACQTCRQVKAELAAADALLHAALSQARANGGFVGRVMAALPAAPESLPQVPYAKPAGTSGPQVFVAPRSWRSLGRRVGIAAAALAAGVLLVWAVASGKFSPFGKDGTALVIKRGRVLGENGQVVRELRLGEVYKVQETTLFPLAKAGLLKVQPGAEFRLEPATRGSSPNVRLNSGDLYVRGKDDQKPVRVVVSSFEAVLQRGDFFVAEDSGETPADVVIVFAGRAEVAFEQETMPLQAGQLFLSVGSGEDTVAQTLELRDAVDQIQLMDIPPVGQGQDLASLRREYETRVREYRRELKVLEQQAGKEQDAQRQAELHKRYQLVLSYCDAHQRRLDAMRRASPYDVIRRGLEGHTDDPAEWM
jgi:hypothetical protein